MSGSAPVEVRVDVAEVRSLLSAADPYLMPLGAARLLAAEGFRHPGASSADDERNVPLLEAALAPALWSDDPDRAAASLLVAAGVVRSL